MAFLGTAQLSRAPGSHLESLTMTFTNHPRTGTFGGSAAPGVGSTQKWLDPLHNLKKIKHIHKEAVRGKKRGYWGPDGSQLLLNSQIASNWP